MPSVLSVDPVAEYGDTHGGEDGFGMELYPSHIERSVAHGHYLTVGAYGCDFETFGETVLVHNP